MKPAHPTIMTPQAEGNSPEEINAASLAYRADNITPVSTSGDQRAAQNHDNQMSKTVRNRVRKRGEGVSEIQTSSVGVDRQGDNALYMLANSHISNG